MRLALISAGLFLLSYVVVNRGLGPHPLLLIIPLLVAIGSAFAARWLMARRRGGSSGADRVRAEADFSDMPPPQRHVPQDRPLASPASTSPASTSPASTSPTPPPRAPGSKARKLF